MITEGFWFYKNTIERYCWEIYTLYMMNLKARGI